ncbi:MAG: hypothetical protein ACKVTZ_16770 [Bacteroidia bacterium]
MWNTENLWFEVAVISTFFALGHIFFGHFEERTSKWRKFFKYIFFLPFFLSLSYFFGRPIAFGFLGIMVLAVIYVHGILLPKKGINGWTGEPKRKYYEFRGWDTDIFKDN